DQSGILAYPTDPKVTARAPEERASTGPPMYHILKSASFGSRITDGCPTPGRSQAPSAPVENIVFMLLSGSSDTVQVTPSVDVANPMLALFAPEVMLN